MKYLLIGFFSRTYMPYMEKYETILKEYRIDYDIVFWNRDAESKDITHIGNEYTFSCVTTTSGLKKLLPVYKYIKFIKTLIRKNRYNKLIIFTTMPAILLRSMLLNEYRGKFIYDYRDTTYEHWNFFRHFVNKIIDSSYFTAISSRGYMHVLDDNPKIIINHNISNESYIVERAKDLSKLERINIGFLGYIRYFDINGRLIDALKNSQKYVLSYYGTCFSNCHLDEYAKSVHAENVFLKGKFNNSEKPKLYQNIDIINSMYSLQSPEVKYAIPNRLYDAALFKIPIMATTNTYLADIIIKYKLGFTFDPNKGDILKKINKYVSDFDPDVFTKHCQDFLQAVSNDEEYLCQRIRDFIKS